MHGGDLMPLYERRTLRGFQQVFDRCCCVSKFACSLYRVEVFGTKRDVETDGCFSGAGSFDLLIVFSG